MNKENVISIANDFFGGIELIKPDLYKAELKIDKKIAGIYYIDLSERIDSKGFENYQEDFLAKDYYSDAGVIQWNYYYLLLRDSDTFKPEDKTIIEKNDKYARKYVLNEEEFKDFFSLEKSNNQLHTNILTKWKADLDSVDLQEVYSDASQTEVLSRFESDITKKIKPEKDVKNLTLKNDTVRFINKVILKPEYRKYPIKVRSFEFGKVNLIKGINGVGKTSLFEAIELIICGKSVRNPDQKEKDGCIEAIFNHSQQIQKYESSNNEKFRSRDLNWYSNNYTRDNYLHNSFNRYNFFNADAAHKFSTSNNDYEVKTALFNIILGPEYDFISDRIRKIYDKLKPIYNKISKELDTAKRDIETLNKEILKYKNSESLTSIKDVISNNTTEIGFSNKFINIELEYITIEEINNSIISLCWSIIEEETVDTLSDLEQKSKDLLAKKKVYKVFEQELSTINEQRQSTETSIKRITQQIDILNSAEKYFSDEKLFSLSGISSRISEKEFELKNVNAVERILSGINLKAYNSSLTIDKIESDNLQKSINYKDDLRTLEINQKNFLARFSKVDQLVQEIKAKGNEYVELNVEAEVCPLCNFDHGRAELESRIHTNATATDASSHTYYIDNNRIIAEINGAFTILNEYNHFIKLVKSACQFANYDTKSTTLDDALVKLNLLISSKVEIDEKLSQFKSLNLLAESKNASEQELNQLKERVILVFNGDVKFEYQNLEVFKVKLVELKSEISKNQSLLNEITKNRESVSLKFKNDFGLSIDEVYTPTQIKELLSQEEKRISLLKSYFEKLQKLVKINNTTSIKSLRMLSDNLSKNIGTLKVEMGNQFQLNTAESKKKEAEKIVAENEPQNVRFKKAKETLERLIEQEGNKEMNDFLDSNLEEIVYIFKMIHSPREFKNIKLVNGFLYLITDDNQQRKITQISTGQRSALALSIFITLNRKLKNGPNIIMFDDPVSFIDDLNALSFLDFLRIFALRENKQIFFATANNRLASLFEKKFLFLGDTDFKRWELAR